MSHIKNSKLRSSAVYLYLILLAMSSAMIPVSLVSGNIYRPMQASETTWKLLESDYPDGSFWDVSFINMTHGWIVGSENSTFASDLIILYTNDGGTTWQLRYKDLFGFGATMDEVDDQVVWVTGSHGALYYTLDGGLTWNKSDVVGAIGGMSCVKFINRTHGWTSSNEVLYWTEDGGQSWDSVPGWNFNVHSLLNLFYYPWYCEHHWSQRRWPGW